MINFNPLSTYWKATTIPWALISLLICLCFTSLIYQTFSINQALRESAPETHHHFEPLQTPQSPIKHLFEIYTSKMPNLPPSKLNLTLEGIALNMFSKNGHRALISAPGQFTKSYQIGDLLPGGSRIHDIQKNQIILETQGNLTRLHLPRPPLRTPQSPAKASIKHPPTPAPH